MDKEIEYSVEQFADHEAICVEREGPYPESAPAAWDALWQWFRDNRLSPESIKRPIGYGMDDPAYTHPKELRYRACLVLHKMPDFDPEGDVDIITIPGGAYAVHRMEGAYTAMPSTFAFLKRCVGERFELDIYRPFQEIYINDPGSAAPEELLTDLCIPIKRPN